MKARIVSVIELCRRYARRIHASSSCDHQIPAKGIVLGRIVIDGEVEGDNFVSDNVLSVDDIVGNRYLPDMVVVP